MMNRSDLMRMLGKGQISRRHFMEAMAAAGIGTAAGLSLMNQAFAATPKRGGHLKLGLAGGHTDDILDGALVGDTFEIVLSMGGCFDCMTVVAADGSLQGELAESWEASADAKTWIFNLRKGVTFHNGKDFGADDVIESINHHRGEDSKSAAKVIVSPIKDMKKDGEHRVVFTLNEGNADFPYLLSDYHLLIMPAGMKEESIAKGIGTGGYILESFDPGVSAMAKRNPNDYLSDRCYFDSFEIIGISDPVARTTAMVTDQVDAINRVDLKTENLLAKKPSVEIFEVTGNQHYTFPMLLDTPPFDNYDVRMALKLAVDREELVQKVLSGHGAVANDHPIGPANPYYNTEMPQRAYDPDKARYHMKKSGLGETAFDLVVSDGAFQGAVDAGALIAESASKAGITINIERAPADGYWSEIWRQKPWCACYWSGRPTEDWMFSTAYQSGVKWNDTRFSNERFDSLLVEARAELNPEKRREMYYEMQVIVNDVGGALVPMYANYVDAASTKLAHGPDISNIWQLDGSRLTERWWFA